MRAAHFERTTNCQRATTTATSQRHRAITGRVRHTGRVRLVPARAAARAHPRVPAGQVDRGAGPASNSGWLGRRLLARACGTPPAAQCDRGAPWPGQRQPPDADEEPVCPVTRICSAGTSCECGGSTPCTVRNIAPCHDVVPAGASSGLNGWHARKQENSTTDARRCTRMGRSPACAFTAKAVRPGMMSRAAAVAHVPSACICVHLWLNFLACVAACRTVSPERPVAAQAVTSCTSEDRTDRVDPGAAATPHAT